MKNVLITGGAGFIGSNYVRYALERHPDWNVVVYDKFTYAGNPDNLVDIAAKFKGRYALVRGDIADREAVFDAVRGNNISVIINFAADSHVDRSIETPGTFIMTDCYGTYELLEAARAFKVERYHQISTDEVYGDLHSSDDFFTETTPYAPSSPYSASKASSDHLVRAWLRTYGLPTLITNCSNNYGPYHFPEKLIPLMILNALAGKPLPVYGNGQQIRDWLYVEDHARALYCVATTGKVGETYNIGGHNERKNLDVVETICELLEELAPNKPQGVVHYRDLITFVADRPGHDLRYAIDASKIARELGWLPQETFESGMRKTVQWYLANESWWKQVQDGSYQGERLGLKG